MQSPFFWWRRVDSNHRSKKQQIYSLSPLATRELLHIQSCVNANSYYKNRSKFCLLLPSKTLGNNIQKRKQNVLDFNQLELANGRSRLRVFTAYSIAATPLPAKNFPPESFLNAETLSGFESVPNSINIQKSENKMFSVLINWSW